VLLVGESSQLVVGGFIFQFGERLDLVVLEDSLFFVDAYGKHKTKATTKLTGGEVGFEV
jgi:hypothetical protein